MTDNTAVSEQRTIYSVDEAWTTGIHWKTMNNQFLISHGTQKSIWDRVKVQI